MTGIERSVEFLRAEVEELKELLGKATPAPWSAVVGSGHNVCTALVCHGEDSKDLPDGQTILVADFLPDWFLENGDGRTNHVPDMVLTEKMRSAVPAMIEELERLWRLEAGQ